MKLYSFKFVFSLEPSTPRTLETSLYLGVHAPNITNASFPPAAETTSLPVSWEMDMDQARPSLLPSIPSSAPCRNILPSRNSMDLIVLVRLFSDPLIAVSSLLEKSTWKKLGRLTLAAIACSHLPSGPHSIATCGAQSRFWEPSKESDCAVKGRHKAHTITAVIQKYKFSFCMFHPPYFTV